MFIVLLPLIFPGCGVEMDRGQKAIYELDCRLAACRSENVTPEETVQILSGRATDLRGVDEYLDNSRLSFLLSEVAKTMNNRASIGIHYWLKLNSLATAMDEGRPLKNDEVFETTVLLDLLLHGNAEAAETGARQ